MKKVIALVLAVVLFATGVFAGAMILNSHVYAKSTVVESVDKENNVVTCVDSNGEAWEFEGTEDWMEGDICSMVMFDSFTATIFDDVILNCRYDGYVY